jgi:hypothetical protein
VCERAREREREREREGVTDREGERDGKETERERETVGAHVYNIYRLIDQRTNAHTRTYTHMGFDTASSASAPGQAALSFSFSGGSTATTSFGTVTPAIVAPAPAFGGVAFRATNTTASSGSLLVLHLTVGRARLR